MLDKTRKALTAAANRVAYGKAPTDRPEQLTEIPLTGLDGQPLDRTVLQGKVVLFVNVASRCGLTPQYTQLVAMHERFRDRGFVVVGQPCNQVLGQEPGDAEAIAEFCSVTYGVDFPLLEKASVNGADRHPLYRFLIGSEAGGGDDISWNFEKFLVGRDGAVLARFGPRTVPDAPEVVAAIENALDA